MPNWKKVIVSGSSAHLNQITGSGGIHLPDNAKITLGDAEDLQLYHDGSNSYIKDNGTGNLNYMGGTQTFQNAAGSKTMMVLNSANSVDLNYNNSTKFQTTNTGVDVTGTITSTGLTTVTQAADYDGIRFRGYDDTNGYYGKIGITDVGYTQIFAEGNRSIDLKSGRQIRFFTSTDNSTYNNSFNLNSDGSSTFSGNVSGSSTSILTMSEISSSGDIVAEGDVVAYNSSDVRLKDNIQVIKGSLDKIDGIRGVEFDWNDKSPGWAQERGHDIGVIAQEVQKVVPEIVVERKNGYLGVDYKRLVPLLIESVKELRQEVNDLKKKVN